MATQTITLTKSGSAWSSAEEAKNELLVDINSTSFTSNFLVDFPPVEPQYEEATLDGQTLTINRSWPTTALYDEYKTQLNTNDSDITNALLAKGWTHSESVE